MVLLILAVAAFLGGALNAISGGGTFLTLPALLLFGALPPITANATSAVAALPGYWGGVAGSKQDLQPIRGIRIPAIIATAALGGATGAALLLLTPAPLFRSLIPWLLLAATALFWLAPRLLTHQTAAPTNKAKVLLPLFAASIYGGYFNGGLGILLLAALSALGLKDMHTKNALKNLISAVLASFSVATFAAAGLVSWPQAATMAAASTLGGYLGARIARKIPQHIMRTIVITTGLTMAILFFRQ